MTGLLEDSQGIIRSLTLAVEFDPPCQPVILYLARDGEMEMGVGLEGGKRQEEGKENER